MNRSDVQDFVRLEYKKYKRKKPPPNFSDVIDFDEVENFENKIERECHFNTEEHLASDCCNVGLKNPTKWKAYWVKSCPGFMFVRNPFLSRSQKYWTHQALTDYTKKPYPCNLDVHMKLDNSKTVWEISQEESPLNPYSFMEKLRWSHLGYHFDYNYVNYKEEKYYGFPDNLSMLMKCIAEVLGFRSYVPETAIVNYYPIGSSMGGHTDHYEEELDAPLISVSFGQPAVFLIGGKTKDIKPEAIWIRSGDIVIMSGEARVAYHAVPCIIKEGLDDKPPEALQYDGCRETKCDCATVQDIKGQSAVKDSMNIEGSSSGLECQFGCKGDNCLWTSLNLSKKEWEPFASYLSKTRININVRQVHKR